MHRFKHYLLTVAIIMPALVLTSTTIAMAKSFEEYRNEGNLHLSQQNYHDATKAYKKALKQNPADTYSRLGFISALQGEEKWDDALSEVNTLIAEHPEFAPAYYNLGEIHQHLGDTEKAKTAYAKYIAKTGKHNLPPSPELRLKFRKLGLL